MSVNLCEEESAVHRKSGLLSCKIGRKLVHHRIVLIHHWVKLVHVRVLNHRRVVLVHVRVVLLRWYMVLHIERLLQWYRGLHIERLSCLLLEWCQCNLAVGFLG